MSPALAASIADWMVLIPPLAVLSTSQVTAEPITTFSMPYKVSTSEPALTCQAFSVAFQAIVPLAKVAVSITVFASSALLVLPYSTSLLAPPLRVSAPAPPSRESAPLPPSSVSLPPRPRT